MNTIKLIWKNLGARIWIIVSSVVLVLVLVISLVITNVPIIYGSLNMWLGDDRANIVGNANYYTSDYKNKAEVYEKAREFNVKIAEEGLTLLKNEESALPLASNAKVTVFGKNSVNLVYGGSGSGGGKASTSIDLYSAFDQVGLEYNPTMKSFYENDSQSGSGRGKNPAIGEIISGFAVGETPISSYTQAVKNSYAQYHDAAIVVISRIGGEGFDLPRTMKKSYSSDVAVDGAVSTNSHYLQLDLNEQSMLKEACSNFNKVVLLINCATSLELGFLDDVNDPMYNANIKAALWMGNPGSTGTIAVGEVLLGKVNPSGRTVDTYARDFTAAPSYANFGNNNVDNGNRYINASTNKNSSYYFVEYEEGLNVGYRYYETRGYEESKNQSSWYRENVVFPFGYGLSYTQFDWTVESVQPEAGEEILPDTEITLTVKVTNKGNTAGKDVVQLYYTAPYTVGGIEKSYVVLADFAKTKLIPAGESDTVKLTLTASDMKSYDYSDANGNGYKGYELEQGEYVLRICKDAHSEVSSVTYHVAQDFRLDEGTVVNRFDDVSNGLNSYYSRADYSSNFPTVPTEEDRRVSDNFIASFKYTVDDKSSDPWYTEIMPTQASSTVKEPTLSLKDLRGLDYDDPKWDELLDQLTVSEMEKLITIGAYGTIALEYIDKPKTYEPDGPSGFTNFMTDGPIQDTCFYACECVVGASWNKELAYEMGLMVGNEGIIGYESGDGLPYSGWYAPAVNIHRSPFSGRNWEYYSEDAYLSGALAAQVIKGCAEKGVYTFVKHFAVNDQETNRDSNGISVWVDEQTMREIYLKPFEMAVKEGGTTAIMSSFNRLGTTWAGGSYALLTEVLRGEWGFNGMVITDYALKDYMNADQMIRAGGDLALVQGGKIISSGGATATQVAALRRATKNILYTTVNSCAMNAEIDGYLMAYWKIWLIVIDVVIVVALAVWGFFAIRKSLKKHNTNNTEEDNTTYTEE